MMDILEKKTSRYLFTWRSILVRFVSITVRYTICVVPFVARMIQPQLPTSQLVEESK